MSDSTCGQRLEAMHRAEAARAPKLADRVTALEDAIEEAVGHLREDWEAGEPINGGDLVNWFGEWRIKAAKVLERRECKVVDGKVQAVIDEYTPECCLICDGMPVQPCQPSRAEKLEAVVKRFVDFAARTPQSRTFTIADIQGIVCEANQALEVKT